MKICLLKANTAIWCRLTNFFSGNFGVGHSCLQLDDKSIISAALGKGVYREAKLNYPARNWIFIDLPEELDESIALKWFEKHKNYKYNILGLFHFIFPFLPEPKKHMFCSQTTASILQAYGYHKYIKSYRIAPNDLLLMWKK